MVKKIIPIIIVILAAFIAGFALLHPGLPPTHDGEYHVVRFAQFNKVLASGVFYPRWAPDLNNGYGVPLFNFVYPLPNYIASLFHLLGASFIDSFKLGMFASLIIGSIFFYLWSKEFWGDLGGVVSSVFYCFTPYHFVDIYIRGSVGEVLALGIFPALAWSITRFIKTRQQKFWAFSSLLFALLIMSHNILGLMFSVFIFFYVLLFILKEKEKKALLFEFLKIAIIGLSISSIFWLPALFEKKFVVGLEIYDVFNNFPSLYQLLIPSWGSGFLASDLGNQISFQIGLANLIVIAISFLSLVFVRKKENGQLVLFFLFWFFLIFFLMLQESGFVWKRVPLMSYFQFPWRFLSLEMIITAFLAGGVVRFSKLKLPLALSLVVISFLLGIGYAKPAYYLYREDSYYTTRSNFIDGTNSPGNAFNTIWFNTKLKKTNGKLTFVKGSGNIENMKIVSSKYMAKINVMQDSIVTVNTAYFPRWSVYADDKKVRVAGTSDGLFSFPLPKGEHLVRVEFEDTYSRSLATIISIIGFMFLLVSLVSARIRTDAKT